jgi:hypothetical protein
VASLLDRRDVLPSLESDLGKALLRQGAPTNGVLYSIYRGKSLDQSCWHPGGMVLIKGNSSQRSDTRIIYFSGAFGHLYLTDSNSVISTTPNDLSNWSSGLWPLLFYSILFYSILFYSILFYSILSNMEVLSNTHSVPNCTSFQTNRFC